MKEVGPGILTHRITLWSPSHQALAPHNPQLKIRFIDNTDPAGIDHQIAQLGQDLASTLVIVTSKVRPHQAPPGNPPVEIRDWRVEE